MPEKITSRFPRKFRTPRGQRRLKCNTQRNYQCGGKCQPLANKCSKETLGMAKDGMEWLKAVEERKARIDKVNAKRGSRTKYAVDEWGTISRGTEGRQADPSKRNYKPDRRNLEELFIDADRLGNKYQTPEEIRASRKELMDVNQAIADVIDEIPDDDEPTPPAKPSKPAKPTGKIYAGISDPTKKRLTSPPPKKGEAAIATPTTPKPTEKAIGNQATPVTPKFKTFNKAVSKKTIANGVKFHAYKNKDVLDKVSNEDLIKEWQNHDLARVAISQWDLFPNGKHASSRALSTTNQFLKQAGGEDYRKALIKVLQDRGIFDQADDSYRIDFNAIKKDRESTTPKPTEKAIATPAAPTKFLKQKTGVSFKTESGDIRTGDIYELPGYEGINFVAVKHKPERTKTAKPMYAIWHKESGLYIDGGKSGESLPDVLTKVKNKLDANGGRNDFESRIATPTPTPKGKSETPSQKKSRQEKADAAIASLEELAKLRIDGENGEKIQPNSKFKKSKFIQKRDERLFTAGQKEVDGEILGDYGVHAAPTNENSVDDGLISITHIPSGRVVAMLGTSNLGDHYGGKKKAALDSAKLYVRLLAEHGIDTSKIDELSPEELKSLQILTSALRRNLSVTEMQKREKDVMERGTTSVDLNADNSFATWAKSELSKPENERSWHKAKPVTKEQIEPPSIQKIESKLERTSSGQVVERSSITDFLDKQDRYIEMEKQSIKDSKTISRFRRIQDYQHDALAAASIYSENNENAPFYVFKNKGKYQLATEQEWAETKQPRMWYEVRGRNVDRINVVPKSQVPKDFSEPRNHIKPHRDRLSKMRELSRRYRG